jgi:hypothetical protein
MFDQILQVLAAYVPNVIAALLILFVGVIIAAIVAAVIRRLLRRVRLDERMGRAMSDAEGRHTDIRPTYWIATAAFWVIMLFAIVGAFQALNLTLVTASFNALLTDVLAFLPRLASAAALAIVAWLIATVLRFAVSRGLRAVHFDERVSAERKAQEQTIHPELPAPEAATPPSGATVTSTATSTVETPWASLTNTLASAVYWLTFLLFLPAILGTLELQGLLAPAEALLTEILLFLPNLLAASAILLVGWFVARVVQRIVTNVAASLGADQLSDRVGLSATLGPRRLSGLLGLTVYVLILIPVIIAALNALQIPGLTAPASAMLASLLNAIPTIFAAAVLIGVSYIVGRVVARLVAELLKSIGFNTWLARMHIWTPPAAELGAPAATTAASASTLTPADVVGSLVLLGIILFATIAALGMLGFGMVATLVFQFTLLVGQIILGLIIFGIGLVLSSLAARTIVASRITQAGLLALAARVAILVLAGAMALRQMGLANEIVNLAFGLLLGALAAAFALAFGLGGREPAQREVEQMFQALHARRIGGAPNASAVPRLDVRERGAQPASDD